MIDCQGKNMRHRITNIGFVDNIACNQSVKINLKGNVQQQQKEYLKKIRKKYLLGPWRNQSTTLWDFMLIHNQQETHSVSERIACARISW